MRDLPGVNEISKSDNDCNLQVKRVKDLAKLKLDVSDYILALAQNMDVEQAKTLKEPKEYVISYDPKVSATVNKNEEINNTNNKEEEER